MAARLTKRPDNRFTVTLTLDGKRRFFYGKTQAEAKAKADEARARVKAGGPVRDATRTLAHWLDEWTETYLALSDRAESTKIMHAGYCRTWIIPTIGHVPLGSLTVNDINRLLLQMKAEGKAESTRRNCYTTLRKALDDAVTNGLLATNPAHKILLEGTSYGYAILKQVRQLSGGELEWTDGMLYPLLHRLERLGYIASEWGASDENRRRRYYRITEAGRTQLADQRRQWATATRALGGLWGLALPAARA